MTFPSSNVQYDVERLLHNFRVNASLPSPAKPYGGWEAPDCGLRGHFTGHYLSACALMFAATGDPVFRERVDQVVDGPAECQQALGDGYLAAFPISEFEKLKTRFFDGVWAPYDTIHKIMAADALQPVSGRPLTYTVRTADEREVTLVPFYELHHQRYSLYWRHGP